MSKVTQESAYRTLDELANDTRGCTSVFGVQPRFSHTVATACCGVFLIALILGLIFVPWVQTVSGFGQVIALLPDERRQNIEAPVDGRIERWFVQEGTRVKKGQKLAELQDLDPRFMERIEKELEAAKAKVTSAALALQASDSNRNRQLRLAQKGLSSQRTAELAEIEYQKHQAELAAARAEVAQIETKKSRQISQRITSPRAGVIQRITAPQGRVFVKMGDPIAVLVPDTDTLVVELTLNGNDLPLVQKGRFARLQFDGWPAVQLPGWPSVAVGTFGGKIQMLDPSDDGLGRFRVLIEPDGNPPWPSKKFLRQGLRVVGWVLLDEVSLGWELWRRFNGFPLQVIPPQDATPSLDQNKQTP